MAVYLINATFLLTLPIELLAGNLNAFQIHQKYYLVKMAVKLLQSVY
ncbi:hypothetical protein ACVPOR_05545 [Staphylococcus aureus]